MKNHTQNAVEIPFPDSFLKNPNWAYLSISSLTFHTICFYCRQVEDSRNKLKLTCRPLAITSYEAFLKANRCLELISLSHFLHDFWRKLLLLLCCITWRNLLILLPLLCEILHNICIAIVCWPGCDVINLEISRIFLTNPFVLHVQKVKTNMLYLENEKIK